MAESGVEGKGETRPDSVRPAYLARFRARQTIKLKFRCIVPLYIEFSLARRGNFATDINEPLLIKIRLRVLICKQSVKYGKDGAESDKTMLEECMKKTIWAAALVVMLAGTSAMAADITMPASYDWSGAYIGLEGGFGFGSAAHSFSNGAPSDNSHPNGLLGGGYIGYNVQRENILFGLEADAALAAVKGGFNNTTGATSSGTSELKNQEAIRVRIGHRMIAFCLISLVVWLWATLISGEVHRADLAAVMTPHSAASLSVVVWNMQ